jgi:hypothetical protein
MAISPFSGHLPSIYIPCFWYAVQRKIWQPLEASRGFDSAFLNAAFSLKVHSFAKLFSGQGLIGHQS